ncbi:MAG: DUF3179 domain-containing protein, partial [Chitinophagales bacterium]
MYQYKSLLIVVFSLWLVLSVGCKNPTQSQQKEEPKEYQYYADWSIDLEYMEPGCSGGYDCIPSVDHPVFIDVKQVDFIKEEDLVVGLKMGDEVRCYPHAILDWHEIVNDQIDAIRFSINYCPLTGSAMAWDRVVNGKETEFGISGLLYNSNVIPYDRATGSHWSQMQQKCINGELYKQKVKTYPVIETTWKTWKILYPKSKVVSTKTGYTRDYNMYPYFDYRENTDIFFPTAFDNDTLHPKERVFGLINADTAVCYRFEKFKYGIGVAYDTVFGKPVIIVGSGLENFMTAFENNLHGQSITVKPVLNKLPGIIEDTDGNVFDVFGYCIAGPAQGKRLN